MPLRLRYVFTSTPNPIRASAGGADPNHVDLQVMVSNPGLDPALLQTITITIPVEIILTSPDGPLAFVAGQKGNLTAIDIAARKAMTTEM